LEEDMIRLATVFSGIGAIEHALQRMGVEHEIVFACDNGDVDILSHKRDSSFLRIVFEIYELERIISLINPRDKYDAEYKKDLAIDLERCYERLGELRELFVGLEKYELESKCVSILKVILDNRNLKASRRSEYEAFLELFGNEDDKEQVQFNAIRVLIEIVNDFLKDNDISLLSSKEKDSFMSKDKIQWKRVVDDLSKIAEILEEIKAKKLLKAMNEISEKLSMLHERINTFDIVKTLYEIKDYSQKKAYVDSLYAPHNKKNKVKESYFANYLIREEDFHWNVSFLDGTQYRDKVDLFVGGSPCQSFSLVGKQRGLDDTRGTLFYEYARLINEIQPKIFIYENVKAVLSNDNGRTWKKMQQVFKELDYTFYHSVLNSKDYGIPQNRERLFVVGFRNDLNLIREFSFPKPMPLNKTMKDYLLDNVSCAYYLNKKGVDFVISEKNLTKRYTQIDGEIQLCQKKNQQFNWHGDFIFVEEEKSREVILQELEKYFLSEKVKKYVLSTGTKTFFIRPKTDLDIARPLLTTMHKMHRAGIDNYVTTEGRLRKLTPRECLRLMGFCDSFKIVVADTPMYQQAGNSIVVDVLIHIVESINLSYPLTTR